MKIALLIAAFSIFGSPLIAQDVNWEPLSPSFGGSPGNSAHLYQGAQLQNKYDNPVELTESERLIENVKARVYSQLSSQLIKELFPTDGTEPPDNGSITLTNGDKIDYVVDGDEIVLTVTDFKGTTTVRLPRSF